MLLLLLVGQLHWGCIRRTRLAYVAVHLAAAVQIHQVRLLLLLLMVLLQLLQNLLSKPVVDEDR